jgi:YHS domain-containing protein
MDKSEKLKGRAITACGGILQDPSRYPSREYRGIQVYFCNQDCLREFEDDPDYFMSGNVVHPVGREKECDVNRSEGSSPAVQNNS